MTFNLTALEGELDKVVSEATTFADLADKYAHIVAGFAGNIPVVGPEVAPLVAVLDVVDKALNALKATLDSLTV